jgi:hypothetical protein
VQFFGLLLPSSAPPTHRSSLLLAHAGWLGFVVGLFFAVFLPLCMLFLLGSLLACCFALRDELQKNFFAALSGWQNDEDCFFTAQSDQLLSLG